MSTKNKQYKDDLIGIKYLINNNKYLKHNINCGHAEFKENKELINLINQMI